MILYGKLIKGTKTIKEAFVEKSEEGISFRDALEECFIGLCKELDIEVPLWIKKNTTEFVNYRRTFFTRDQFMDEVLFDRLEIRIG